GPRIARDEENAARTKHALHLRVEAVEVEPMERLGHAHGVEARIGQRRALRRLDRVADAQRLDRALDLLRARIGRLDVREMAGEAERGLAVAGPAIPCRVPSAGPA